MLLENLRVLHPSSCTMLVVDWWERASWTIYVGQMKVTLSLNISEVQEALKE